MATYDEVEAYNYQQAQQNARTTPEEEYASTLREERVRTLLTEIDPQNLVHTIIMGIRGYRYDKNREDWVRRPDAAQISENFIGKVEYVLNAELALNTTFGNLQTSDVNKIMDLLIEILVSDVVVHGGEYTVTMKGEVYNLSDDHNLKEVVLYGIFSSVYKCLRRSINGTEARRFFGSLRMNETINPPKGGKGGVLESLKALYS